MSDRNSDFDRDDALRALLRRADPARSLPAADPAALARLLGEVVGSGAAAPRRTRTSWLVAAAAAVVVAGLGAYAVGSRGGDDDQVPAAGPSTGPSTGVSTGNPPAGPTQTPGDVVGPVPGTMTLAAPSLEGKCAVLSPALVAAQEQAFEAKVVSIQAGKVTLQTDQVYAGDVAQTVEVIAPSAELRQLVQATDFQVGKSYLVAASSGMVAPCGVTGKDSGHLRSLYEKAFVH